MIRLKTAVLLAASLKIGALIAGADEDECEKIYNFGENLGIAFQLQDDLLDAFGNEGLFGKKTGGDIVANKKTFLYLKAFESANSEDRERLKTLYSTRNQNDEEKVVEVLGIFERCGIASLAEEVIKGYYDKALLNLASIRLSEESKTMLLRLAEGMLKRNH
jgi:geranylgeranyl diphosphate synthase, type II